MKRLRSRSRVPSGKLHARHDCRTRNHRLRFAPGQRPLEGHEDPLAHFLDVPRSRVKDVATAAVAVGGTAKAEDGRGEPPGDNSSPSSDASRAKSFRRESIISKFRSLPTLARIVFRIRQATPNDDHRDVHGIPHPSAGSVSPTGRESCEFLDWPRVLIGTSHDTRISGDFQLSGSIDILRRQS